MYTSQIDRYRRLWRTHVLKHGGVRKLWTTPGKLNQARLDHPEDLLLGYFLDFSSDAQYSGPFDAQGVPLIDYGGSVGLRYNPWAVGHFAIACFHKYLQTRASSDRQRFLTLADWFVLQGQRHPTNGVLWSYDFDYPPGLKAPWFSSLAQSVAISVLLRAYLWTDDSKYLDIARGSFQTFKLSVSEGGVSMRDGAGHLFFEETVPVRIYHILNGFISTLWGIYEYAVVAQDHHAETLLGEGLSSLKYYLPEYDIGWASLYSLYHLHARSRLKDVASPFYQEFHVLQLNVLHRLTGWTIFAEYSKRWKSYLLNPLCQARTLGAKALFKLFYY